MFITSKYLVHWLCARSVRSGHLQAQGGARSWWNSEKGGGGGVKQSVELGKLRYVPGRPRPTPTIVKGRKTSDKDVRCYLIDPSHSSEAEEHSEISPNATKLPPISFFWGSRPLFEIGHLRYPVAGYVFFSCCNHHMRLWRPRESTAVRLRQKNTHGC